MSKSFRINTVCHIQDDQYCSKRCAHMAWNAGEDSYECLLFGNYIGGYSDPWRPPFRCESCIEAEQERSRGAEIQEKVQTKEWAIEVQYSSGDPRQVLYYATMPNFETASTVIGFMLLQGDGFLRVPCDGEFGDKEMLAVPISKIDAVRVKEMKKEPGETREDGLRLQQIKERGNNV